MSMPRQLALALPHAENFSHEDFLTGASNEAAVSLVERWPDWPDRTLAIVGPEGAGKSHLAAIWADIAGARRVSARVLDEVNLPAALATGALVIEDAAEQLDERALFHLLNLVHQQEGFALLTTRAPPATWRVDLPDLASRLRAIPTVELRSPDDALLRAVMVKLFADRQLAVDEALIAYLPTRIERSFAAARAAVEDLDREALRQKRPVTRALAAELLGQR
ncbi:MAG: chromosomal replication initiator DnaA [Xanthobacteraceae bacterium]|jgi:chromosomal replication initiation ATPase DnaA